MYLLTWNSAKSRIEATFGGRISKKEATHFSDELKSLLAARDDADFKVLVDLSTINSMPKKVEESLLESREVCLSSGAKNVTYITGDEEKAQLRRSQRMEQVLDGSEQYVPYLHAS